MSTTPSVQDDAFDPEMLEVVGRAFTAVCARLGLAPDRDPRASYVARTVLGFGSRGMRDGDALAAAVMQRLEDEAVIGWNGEQFAVQAREPHGRERAAS
jgi:hypothetical protein